MELSVLQNIESQQEIKNLFSQEATCINFLEALRWKGDVVSPFDENSRVYECSKMRYRCRNSGKYFNVRTNTIFHGSKVTLSKWFEAIWLVWNYPNTNIMELSRKLDVSPKTAWLMQKRIARLVEKKPAEPTVGMALTDWLNRLQ
ncbi:IS1 family transposase [Flavobacterium selenitireducens]|uniref:IS1 family transposase n=1 Tax=Flavobacterium selenitireducens TaxID=2722704 RepID=UPI00168AA44A|nr:IS1 family transposase [Flavobacterium selenitireducens]MBD3582136.1 IS1 family transposase [Flavobacterium selenitireducens]